MNHKMNKYIKNYFLSVLNTGMAVLFPIITFPYVTRVLGASNLGIINFAQSYGYYFVHIASFGINSYAIREVSKIRDEKDRVERISNEIFNINCFFSIISTILYLLGMVVISNFRDNYVVFLLYSVVILTNFLAIDWLLQSFDDYFFSTVRNFIIRLLSVLAVFVFVKKPDDYYAYMLISCVTEMGARVSTLLYSRKTYVHLKLDIKYLNFKAHIKHLFTLFVFRMVNGISANLDKLMIGFMMLYSNVGVYSAGVKIITLLQTIVETFGIVLFPKINISTGFSKDDYYKNLRTNYNLILLLGIPMAMGVFLISPRLIPFIAGDEYEEAVMVSRIMAFVILVGPIGDMLGSKTLLIFKKEKWLLICSIISAISNIVLNAIFIPFWGISGAAMATLISSLVSTMTRYYFTNQFLEVRLITKNLLKYFSFTIPFVVIYLLFRVSINNSTVHMFSFIFVCVVVYAFELIVSKDETSIMVLKKIF